MPEAAEQTHDEANDVAASVAAAFDKLEADSNDEADVPHETSPEPEQEVTEPTDPAPTEQAVEEQPGETDNAVQQGQEASPETETPVETPPSESSAAPDHWRAEDREMFAKQSPEVQDFLLNRHKEMEANYTQKTMEVADLKREYEPVDQMMRAFTPLMQQQGIGPGALIRKWAQAESYLNSQPEQAIKQLANYYGVDLAAIAYDQPAQQQHTNDGPDQVDPQVQSLQTQVHNLSTQQHLQTINAFADAVDAQGNKLRPYFDEVAQTIGQDLQAAKALGLQPSLEELYEQACWKTPAVREKLVAATAQPQGQQTDEKRAEQARIAAEKARKASKSISGDAGSAVEPRPEYNTIEEAATAAFDKHTH